MPNAKSSNLKEEKLIVQKGFLILETFWFSNLTSFEWSRQNPNVNQDMYLSAETGGAVEYLHTK